MSDEYFREQRREREKENEAIKQKHRKEREREEDEIQKLKEAEYEKALNSPAKKIWGLYYICHIENLSGIIENGILSPNLVKKKNLNPAQIRDKKISNKRSNKVVRDNSAFIERSISLDNYAHTFFFPRNPMLYRVAVIEKQQVVVIKMHLDISKPNLFITIKSAVSFQRELYSSSKYYDVVPQLDNIKKKSEITKYFNNDPDPEYEYDLSSECLIPNEVPSDIFEQIHVNNNDDMERKVQNIIVESKRPQLKVVQDSRMFFNTWED